MRKERRGVTLELVTNGFYGEPQPDGTMRLVIPAYAYHQWRGELRYVLLLGDGSYDFKGGCPGEC